VETNLDQETTSSTEKKAESDSEEKVLPNVEKEDGNSDQEVAPESS
jgi:hypothetical protein